MDQENLVKKIKVGLLIDDVIIPAWSYRMIEKLLSSDFAEVVLVVRKKQAVVKRTLAARFKENHRYLFYRLFKRLESNLTRSTPDAFENKDLSDLIKSSEYLEVECIEKKFSDYVKEQDIAKISSYNVDVFIRLGFRILRGDILRSAKFGVWSFHHGDNLVNRGGPAGFWEVFKREKEIGSILQILTEDLDGGEVLYRSWSTVHTFHQDTLNELYWKTSLFIERKLKELYVLGEEEFLKKLKLENEHLKFYSNKLYTIPQNFTFLKLFISHFSKWAKHRVWKAFNVEQWVLLYCFNNKNQPATSIFRYKRLLPPKDRFWADPFVIFESDKYFIFFEELVYKDGGKGHLSVLEIDNKGITAPSKIILKKPYHLSYPFVFKYEGEYYLIPESEEDSTIQLYKAKKFPYDWEFQMNLMENIKAVDTTIFVKDGTVWLFTNVVAIEGAPYTDELFLFSSDTLFSNKWESHPFNPIVSDVKCARSAGKIFNHNGKFYRPSQDCSYMYGYAVAINEILVMNKKEYRERKVSDICPDWADDVIATHSFSYDNKLSAVDAVVKRRKQLF